MSDPGSSRSAAVPALDLLVEEIADLRPLPPVAAHVLQIAEGEHFSAHELAQAISSDPALTARVLRIANSAYYGFPRRITTVRDAVVLLGFRQVRSTVLAACAIEALPAASSRSNIVPSAFWQHSVTVGMLAEVMARSAREHLESAFTAGVLHNIGRLALDQVRPDAFRDVIQLASQRGIALPEAQREVFGFTDAEVGGALALRWQFPADLALAIAQHQRPFGALCASAGLARLVVEARAFASIRGVTDGVEPTVEASRYVSTAPARGAAPASPFPLASLLEQDGGFEALVNRAAAFVEQTSTGP